MTDIDLHIHTNNSDGRFSPFEIIDMAKKTGVKIIAIADHDTVASYTKDVIDYAKRNNINLIPAVEISTKTNKCGIHVLGYFKDYKFNESFLKQLETIRNARHIYLKDVSKKLGELGYIVNTDELDKVDAVTKAHIAKDIVTNEKNKNILLRKFGHIPSQGEFIETVMNEGCEAYVAKKAITPKQASELIKSNNGKVVLAHPVAYQYEDGLSDDEILKIVKDMNADGIEANYIYTDRNNVIHNDTKKWNEFAKKNNLYTTVGSDFHNIEKDKAALGFTNLDYKVADEYKDLLFKDVISIKKSQIIVKIKEL